MTTVDRPRHIDIVMTTIGDSAAFFDAYRGLIARHRGDERIRLVVVPDRKTPRPSSTSASGPVQRAWTS